MNKFFKILLICGFILMQEVNGFCAQSENSANLLTVKIKYYGNYVEKVYEPFPGTKPIKLPTEISSWPGDFYDPPDVVEVKIEVQNNSSFSLNNVIFDSSLRYKVGKLIEDDNGIDIEKSKNGIKWLDYFFTKSYTIKSIKPKETVIVNIMNLNLIKDLDIFYKTKDRPWQCETKVRFIRPKASQIFSRILSIDLI